MDEKQKVINIVKEIGFLTGSRAFGLAKENSDHDYVVLFSDFRDALDKVDIHLDFGNPHIEKNMPEYITTDKGIYDIKDGFFKSYRIKSYILMEEIPEDYNILMVWNERELEVWNYATKVLMTMPLEMVKDKENRAELFEIFKNVKRRCFNE